MSHDQWQSGFNDPDGLHTSASAIHGAAQAQLIRDSFRPARLTVLQTTQSAAEPSTLADTAKGFGIVGAVIAATYGLVSTQAWGIALIYAVPGALGGFVFGAALHVFFQVLWVLLRFAALVVGALLLFAAVASFL